MMSMERFVHGGQGRVAPVALPATIHAVVRPRWGVIRVWQGHAPYEDFSFHEARALCVAGDAALLNRDDACQLPGQAAIYAGPDEDGEHRPLIVPRLWLVAFLAAVRKALRTLDAANEMAGTAH